MESAEISAPLHLVLFRGLVREAAHWSEDFLSALKRRFPNSHITRIDMPGAGEHYQKRCPTTLDAIVDHMRQDYLANKKEGEKTIFITISMGGMVGVNWESRYPEDMDGLVLMNISLGNFSPFYHRMRPKAWPMVFSQSYLRSIYDKEMAQIKMVSNRPEIYESLAKNWEEIHKKRPMSLINKFNQLWAAGFYRGPDKAPKCPILVLVGENDRLVKSECSYAIHRAWGGELQSHPSAGHAISIDAPEWCVKKIGDWYQKTF